jgi:hypothetical protein
VLHRSGRAVEALDAFSRALGEMDRRQARAWNDPQVLVESPVHRWLRNPVGLTSDEALRRFWLLADPLYLTPGNERLAEHYSRRFAASIYAGTALTIGLSWGRPFEELLVRYGFIAGWERTFPRIGEAPDGSVVERYHPESRGLLPPLEALENPRGLGEGVWVPQDDRPRSSSAPALAPLVVEGLGQVARFRRDGNLLILAAYGTPEDTLLSRRRSRAGILEWVDAVAPRGSDPLPGQDHPGASLPDTLAGLFLVPEKGDGPPLAAFGREGRGCSSSRLHWGGTSSAWSCGAIRSDGGPVSGRVSRCSLFPPTCPPSRIFSCSMAKGTCPTPSPTPCPGCGPEPTWNRMLPSPWHGRSTDSEQGGNRSPSD